MPAVCLQIISRTKLTMPYYMAQLVKVRYICGRHPTLLNAEYAVPKLQILYCQAYICNSSSFLLEGPRYLKK